MSQRGGARDAQGVEVEMVVGEQSVPITIEPEIADMFDRIQQKTNQEKSLEEVLINFLNQYKPKIEQEFESAIFSDYQQVRLQEKVNQNGDISIDDVGVPDEDDGGSGPARGPRS